ncbi:MAG: ComF family protein [Holosporaceae bacterium]|jgi:ComF family protein|nr:ComF family protein [Holosporaceae bacterium]
MIFPITCCNCEEFVESEGLCSECWNKIRWIGDPKCRICGVPFEFGVDLTCPMCSKRKPHFDKAIAVFEYDDFTKKVILKFKYNDTTYISKQLAAWMYRVSKNTVQKKVDFIVPVPIHFFKRLKRKYNQSELLALEFAKLSGISYEPRILLKKKSTPQQEGLSRNVRLKNVQGSFGIDEKYRNLLHKKTILLIDDVLTTGATINECSKILKKHGAEKIICVTAARVNLQYKFSN